jgi:hypothetical protein
MQFAGWFAPWKLTNCAEKLVLWALQFQKVSVCRELSGWMGISYDKPNK